MGSNPTGTVNEKKIVFLAKKMTGDNPKPFLRWIGGKGKNIEQFSRFIPGNLGSFYYVEPFVGSGAMLFRKKPGRGLVSDINENLINCYSCIKENLKEFIEILSKHESMDSEKYYYETREKYNESNINDEKTEQATRFIYLNARCYNGLYRENKSGKFNAPYAKDLKGMKKIVVKSLYESISRYLNGNGIEIECFSFEKSLDFLELKNTGRRFFFIDPPYYPINLTSRFTSYTNYVWNDESFVKLKEFAKKISERKDFFLICNNSVPFIKKLFENYNQQEHIVSRSISCKPGERNPVKEIVITNYKIKKYTLDDF